MNHKNYYQILGVAPTASNYEIKAAYRRLAQIYHPDKNANDKEAENVFKEVNEAYHVLSNKEKRAEFHRIYAEASYSQKEKGAPFFSTELLLLKLAQMKQRIAETDPYRMDTTGLFQELEQLYSAFHLGVIKKEDNIRNNNQAVATTLYILNFLPFDQQKVILLDLEKMEHTKGPEVIYFNKRQKTRRLWRRYKIWLVLIASILMCLLLYKLIQVN